jgi:hypothetical protein
MRKAGLIATLLAGFGLLGASLHGMTRVDETLRIAAATPAPKVVAPDPQPVVERPHRGRWCDEDRERKGPRV